MKNQVFFRTIQVLTLLLAILSASIIEADAQDTLTIQIPASKDNTLYEDVSGSFSNGSGAYFFVGRTAQFSNYLRRGVISFDVTGSIPAGSQITSAQLRLNMSKTISGAASVKLHRLSADWGEGTSNAAGNEGGGAFSAPLDATWIHSLFDTDFWNAAGGDYEVTASATTSVSVIGAYLFGSTTFTISDVQQWLDDPASNFGWILIGDELTSSSAKRFDTRENPIASNRPLLTVRFVQPECCIGNRGDCNNDGNDGNILDLNFLVNRIFRSGPPPVCAKEADVNSDGNSGNILDLNFLINRIFRSGPAPGPC